MAFSVRDVREAVSWYRKTFRCEVRYQDATGALLAFQNVLLALVIPEEHPPHLALVNERAEEFGPLKPHRDGTRSTYIKDPAGNSIEVLAPTE